MSQDHDFQSKQSEPVFKPGVRERLQAASPRVVELGCGDRRGVPGAVTVDVRDLESVDIVADLDRGLPLDSGFLDEVHCHHFLEHVADLGFMLREIARVLRPGGRLAGSVPHFANPYFYADPTHRAFFGLYTFSYFLERQEPLRRKVPVYGEPLPLHIQRLELVFKSAFQGRKWFKGLCTRLFNTSTWFQEFHEENLCWLLPAYELRFELRRLDS